MKIVHYSRRHVGRDIYEIQHSNVPTFSEFPNILTNVNTAIRTCPNPHEAAYSQPFPLTKLATASTSTSGSTGFGTCF